VSAEDLRQTTVWVRLVVKHPPEFDPFETVDNYLDEGCLQDRVNSAVNATNDLPPPGEATEDFDANAVEEAGVYTEAQAVDLLTRQP
jgi:hypothetical protein